MHGFKTSRSVHQPGPAWTWPNSPRESRTDTAQHICYIQILPQEHRSGKAVSSKPLRKAFAHNRTPRKAKTIATRPRNGSDTQCSASANTLLATQLSSGIRRCLFISLGDAEARLTASTYTAASSHCPKLAIKNHARTLLALPNCVITSHFPNCHGLLARSGRAHPELLQRRRNCCSTAIQP